MYTYWNGLSPLHGQILTTFSESDGDGVSQYVVKYAAIYLLAINRLLIRFRCAEDEKFLLIYVIFKLKLVKGKCIIFVADIDRCYRLKLYLEQFGTKSCILNSELPVNSRIHVVEEYNKGVYDIIIASDEHELLGDEDDLEEPALKSAEDPTKSTETKSMEENTERTKEPATKKQRIDKRDKNYGVARGSKSSFHSQICITNF